MTFVASVSVDVDGRELVAEVDGTEPDHAPVRHRGLRKLDADVVAAAESLEDQGRCSLDDEARGLRAEDLERCIHGGGGEPLLFASAVSTSSTITVRIVRLLRKGC